MNTPPSRQLLRSSRIRKLTALQAGQRSNSTRSDGFTGWSVRTPKDILRHLSQYIVGQDKAKRILSVAVFNHYTRITPPAPPPPIPPTSPSQSSTARSPGYTTLESNTFPSIPLPVPSSSSQRLPPLSPIDPSRANLDLERDITRIGSSPDPTLTHDLLTDRSREGRWAKGLEGYFDKSHPSPSLLGNALKARRSRKQFLPEEPLEEEWTPRERRRKSKAESRKVEEVEERVEGSARGRKEDVVLEKSNVLMVGPTGTGKTLMARTLARILDVPFASCDATSYTQAGYVGEDVENCVLRLLQAAEFDVNRAEVGIIHIDEIDKLARRGGGESWGSGRDVGGEGVQQALLRLLEGTTLTLSAKPPAISSSLSSSSSPTSPSSGPNGTSGGSSPSGTKAESGMAYGDPPWDPREQNRGFGAKRGVREGLPGFGGGSGGSSGGKGETFVVDTSNILFILSGAFVGLDSIVSRRLGKGSIGFNAPLPFHSPTAISPDVLTSLLPADLSTYGLIPEFLGRLPILSTLHPLSISDLVRILVEPKNALIKQYEYMFEKYGSELRFTKSAIEEIAKLGLERGGGARGLRGFMEGLLTEAMFEVPGSEYRYCLVNGRMVRGEGSALYFTRREKEVFERAIEDEDAEMEDRAGFATEAEVDEVEQPEKLSATG
ncbi:ATP-dependent Clp protease ATP-binding subunit ClpX, partial [Tremellales sp. Uapishka_1]